MMRDYSSAGADIGAAHPWLRHFRWLVPFRWFDADRYPRLSFVWFATHGAQWGWEICEQYRADGLLPPPGAQP